MPGDPRDRDPLDAAGGARPRRSSNSAEYAAVAVLFFSLNGVSILYSPMWSLCFPLAWLGPIASVIALAKVVSERRKQRPHADSLRPMPGAARTAFVVGIAVLILVHLAAGGNGLWFRLGVEWRLRQVGGLTRVEAWTVEHVASLRQRLDAVGGPQGMDALSDEERKQFLFVHPPARPEWLKPLTSYLPARVSNDASGRPDGINFSLGGWDHGWGLSVSAEPPPADDGATSPQRWPYRLSDRSHLWGQPW